MWKAGVFWRKPGSGRDNNPVHVHCRTASTPRGYNAPVHATGLAFVAYKAHNVRVSQKTDTMPIQEEPIEATAPEGTPEPEIEEAEWEPVPDVPAVREVTRVRMRDLGRLFTKYARHYWPHTPVPPPPGADQPPRVTGTHAAALKFLRWIPVVLLLMFFGSFLWDFPGWEVSLLGQTYALDGLVRITSVSGLIGFLTNWLAITMLFQPRKRRPIFGQGLIPAQRDRVIFRLAQGVSEELINEEIIKQKIQESGAITKYREMALHVVQGIVEDEGFRAEFKALLIGYAQQVFSTPEVRNRLAELLVNKLEEHAGEGIQGLALKAYRFFKEDEFQAQIDRAIRDLPTTLDTLLDETDTFLGAVPSKLEAHADEIENWVTATILGFVERLDIYTMIRTNMEQFDEQRLENLLKRTTNEQLNYIKYLGGILGLFGGLVIWQPVPALVVFATIGGILYGLDVLLFKRLEDAR